jgi:transcription elongation factor Elf1
MLDFVDIQYAQHLSGRLDRYRIKHTNPYKINFRCPLCGDSKKNRSKARGWLLEKDNKLFYFCHNCGASHAFANFLKVIDPLAYNDYIAEKYIGKANNTLISVESTLETTKFEQPKFSHTERLKNLKKVSQLNHTHPVKKYIDIRQIPSKHHYRLYFAPKFMEWVNSIIPNKFDNIKKDEPRLVIPFLDKEGTCFGVAARSMDPDAYLRYISIMFDEVPKIFGLDKVNFNEKYYVVEGALDSMFLSNAVAMAGADGGTAALSRTENAVFVFDAEPRNREIHKRMEKIIDAGHSIVIWPHDIPGKDINEMVLSGKISCVESLMRTITYKGLDAKMKFQQWRRT